MKMFAHRGNVGYFCGTHHVRLNVIIIQLLGKQSYHLQLLNKEIIN